MRRFQSAHHALTVLVLGALAVALAGAAGCNGETDLSAPWWEPFVTASQGAQCVDIRNRLYVIDNQLVFTDQQGSCTDQMYSWVLYGRTVDDVKCAAYDSLGGSHNTCTDPSYRPMFNTILSHRDEADLGLGSSHHVMRVQI